jgi:hypothetical protein
MQQRTGSILQDATVNNWPTGPTKTNGLNNLLDSILGDFDSLLSPASEIPSLDDTLHTTSTDNTIQPQVLPIPSTVPGIGAIYNSNVTMVEHIPTTLMFDRADNFSDESDNDIDQDDDEHTMHKVSSFIKDFMEANPDPEALPNKRVQFPRKAVSSKVSKVTQNALTKVKHAKKACFIAALECIY